jgi:hypothetical protein
VITRPYANHGRTDRFDDAGTFVTQHRRERHGIILISNEHVSMADAGSDHPDDYIVRTRRVDTGPLDLEPSPFLPHDSYRDIVPRFHVGVRHYKISLAYSLMGGNLHHWKKFILPRSAANPRLAPERRSGFRRPPMLLLLERSLWRISEADRHSVVGVHQADRDRKIDQFLFLEDRARGLERFIRHAGL